MSFETIFQVAWAHLDGNGHMANTAYLDLCVDVRFMYFASQGFAPHEFRAHNLGPVVRRDEVDYYRELRLHQTVRINFMAAGLSEDASRFRIVNEIRREDAELCARVTSLGGWLDLSARKLIAPPPRLADALFALPRTEDFEALPSSAR